MIIYIVGREKSIIYFIIKNMGDYYASIALTYSAKELHVQEDISPDSTFSRTSSADMEYVMPLVDVSVLFIPHCADTYILFL